ncbi:MAG: hypothetical protein Q4F52_07080 [Bacteroidaceae bacterium]|nr:hypothetical protein [Bacteroidaceae bacterium]
MSATSVADKSKPSKMSATSVADKSKPSEMSETLVADKSKPSEMSAKGFGKYLMTILGEFSKSR